MSTFAVNNSDPAAVVDAVNYLLANMGQGGSGTGNVSTGNSLQANTTTGQVTTSGGNIVSYLYRYILVRYSNSPDGSGMTTSPTNKAYYGLYNNNDSNPSGASSPANYQWTQVTGGFGTTKFLWYATYGGGQVAWFAGTAAPNSSYAQVIDNTPVDLNFVTATSTLPLVTPFVYLQSANVPATPTGGTYDFGNLRLTAPSGWSNSLPASSNTIPTYTSQAKFQAVPSGANVGPTGSWSVPIALVQNGANGANGVNGSNGISTVNYNVFLSQNTAPATPSGGYYNFATGAGTPPSGWSNSPVSDNGAPIYASTASLRSTDPNANVSIGSSWTTPFQYTGAGGAQGERGPIPMAYVLTPTSPLTADTVTLSSWFGASRNNTTAPIGMGTPPITLDTACFTQQGNTDANVVYTFSSTTNTWTSVQGAVVNGNVFVTGSVNAAAMNANDVYALTMKGGTVTPGVNSGTGFWLQANTGNAYMGGNLYIGNTATIGNNLKIGNNANIGNSLTIGTNLIVGASANIGSDLTVGTNAVIGNNANIGGNLTVGNDAVIGESLKIGNNAVIGNTLGIGNNAYIGNSLVIGNNALIGNSLAIGNNATIGNSVAIGNNATIGGNLTVAGLITGSGVGAVLNANVVNTVQMVNNSVSLYYSDEHYTDQVINTPVSLQYYLTNMALSNISLPENSTTIATVTFADSLSLGASGAATGFQFADYITLQAKLSSASTWSDLFTTVDGSGYILNNLYGSYGARLVLQNALLPIGPGQSGTFDFRVLWAYQGPIRVYGTNALPTVNSATLSAQVFTLQVYKK